MSVQNYRSLRRIELKGLTPLTVFLGPNGSGKSTIFDAFAFLSESFGLGLRKAWDKRGRFKELRSRGEDGTIIFEVKYREKKHSPLITYHLEINEDIKGPFVAREFLSWKRGSHGRPFRFLDFTDGVGGVVTGEEPDEQATRTEERLAARDLLAVNTLGQLAKHPRVGALRRFISGWYLSYVSADNTRGAPEAGPQERLSSSGDNLPNVIQYLKEQHEGRLQEILAKLIKRVPRLEKVDAEVMLDGRLLLTVKDAPFDRPVMSKFASDGTLKMLAYLTLLHDPDPPQLIGIEEPENQLHPRLLPELAEECRSAAAAAQLMVTTHSPFFLNALHPDEAWVLYRTADGFTNARRVSEMQGIKEFMAEGAQLGNLWMEGHFDVGDPLTNAGAERRPLAAKKSRRR